MRASVTVAVLFASLIALAPRALAQSQATTGLIEGTVSDASGGRLPGATVTLRQHRDQLHARPGHRQRTAAFAACCCRWARIG